LSNSETIDIVIDTEIRKNSLPTNQLLSTSLIIKYTYR